MTDPTDRRPAATSDDVDAIRRLKARYFRLMDTKQWDEMRSVFTDDCHFDTTADGAPEIDGADRFLAMIRRFIEHAVTVHHGHMPEIELTGPDSATGVWAMEDELWFPDGGPIRHLHGFGHYHETYRRTPDGWRIASLRLTRLRVDRQ